MKSGVVVILISSLCPGSGEYNGSSILPLGTKA